jgi:hypothetical protein
MGQVPPRGWVARALFSLRGLARSICCRMPYSDPEKQRAAVNAAQRRRYAADAEFRERKLEARQAHRKTEEGAKGNREGVKRWRETHPEEYRAYNRERMRRSRAAKKAAEAATANAATTAAATGTAGKSKADGKGKTAGKAKATAKKKSKKQ